MASWSDDENPPVQPVDKFAVLAFRTVDRWRHGVMLTARLETEEVLYLAFTPEQAQLLKEELEKVIPVAKRRDA